MGGGGGCFSVRSLMDSFPLNILLYVDYRYHLFWRRNQKKLLNACLHGVATLKDIIDLFKNKIPKYQIVLNSAIG